MCGINCIFSIRKRALYPLVASMNHQIRHRGPDDEGYILYEVGKADVEVLGGEDTPLEIFAHTSDYTPTKNPADMEPPEANVALGHRRLSIIDLSPAGHQPMSYQKGRYWIVFNGEIYNYKQLREELSAAGYEFRSQSDTEVILAAYAHWGKDCLCKFNGMWAFLILDIEEQTLFAARDRFGVKPLYYWSSPEGLLAFSSEIKAFTVLPGWSANLDHDSAYDYLLFGVGDHARGTMFKGVSQLMAGEAVEIKLSDDLSSVRPFRYYDLAKELTMEEPASPGERFHELLRESVRMRLVADVPVGSCLSGGLDSSAIVCLINELVRAGGENKYQNTFSAIAQDPKFDESTYIDEVTRATGTSSWRTVPELEELLGAVDRLTYHQDEPFGSTSIFAQWKVFELARSKQVKVMLDGQGADEQLAGYHAFLFCKLAQDAEGLRIRKLLSEMKAIKKIHGYRYRLQVRSILDLLLRPSILSKTSSGDGWDWINLEAKGYLATNGATTQKPTTVRDLNLVQIHYTSLPRLLHYEDRNSMAHSVESRVPFLDYRLVQFDVSLCPDTLVDNGVTKRVMREGLKGTLPEAVRTRMDKIGFATPEEAWMKAHKQEFVELLRQSIERSGGIIKGQILEEFKDALEGRRPLDVRYWRAINFGIWVKVFNVNVS